MVNKGLRYQKNLWVTIYADFEILASEDNGGKKDPNESYTNKYQKHITCRCNYKSV